MIQAMSTGHKGSLSTGHSDSPKDMLNRLTTMILMAMEMPIIAIERQIASAIDIIIHIGRLRDKSRKVLEVTEIIGYENNEIRTSILYQFQETAEKTDKVVGTWRKIQNLQNTEKLLSAGYTNF